MAAVPLGRRTAASSTAWHVQSLAFTTQQGGRCRVPPRRFFSCNAVVRVTQPSTLSSSSLSSTSTLRNVSFWGHIDAGKTTLTEKVLYLANALLPPEPAGQGGVSSGNFMMPGDVDSGSTVTDFLEAERQRGITIQSAAVGPFSWKTKLLSEGSESATATSDITLIDTPGHIDFTIEVERSLRVADGCVVLIDGVEGVESQTEGVWRIAQRYNLRSHVVFINKMDRMGSSLVRSLRSIVAKGLHSRPTLLQLPIFSDASATSSSSTVEQQKLVGLVDLTAMPLRAHFYGGRAGEDVTSITLDEAVQQGRATAALAEEARQARAQIIEQLANLDETLLEKTFKAMEDIEGADSGTDDYTVLIAADSVRQAIRRLVVRGEILPVLCGSAAKGVGVQAVLDAIAAYLPSPGEAGDFEAAALRQQSSGCVWGKVRVPQEGEVSTALNKKQQKQQKRQNYSASVKAAAATPEETSLLQQKQQRDEMQVSISIEDTSLSLLAFKVVWDKRRGPMTFVRVYSGSLTRANTLLNTTTGARERLAKILHVYADRHVETDKLVAGQIGVLLGLKDTRTGDTLVDARPAGHGGGIGSARKGKHARASSEDVMPWQAHAFTLALRRVNVPPPVFSMSVEAMSKSDEGPLREALDMLIRTDPSLHLDQAGAAGSSSTGGTAALGSAAASTGGQVVLSGMGELHLEIARDRLIEEFGARAHLGNVRVSYRETTVGYGSDDEIAQETSELDVTLDRTVLGQKLKASCRIAVRPLATGETGEARLGGNLIDIEQVSDDVGDVTGADAASGQVDSSANTGASQLDSEAVRRALQAGLMAALSRGPLSGNPVTGLYVCVDNIQSFGPVLSPVKAFSLLAAQAVREALKQRGTVLMEPFTDVRIRCDDDFMGKVVSNLTSEQEGTVEGVSHDDDFEDKAAKHAAAENSGGIYIPSSLSVDGPTHVDENDKGGGSATGHGSVANRDEHGKCTISAVVPLVKLVRYSSTLRALTRGKATYEMAFRGFAVVSPERQRSLLVDLGRL